MLTLSKECRLLAEEYCQREVTLPELFRRLGPKGGAFVALLLSLPFILWVALPGLSLIFGLVIFTNEVQIIRKRGMWAPPFVKKKRFSGKKLARLLLRSAALLERVERCVRPRFQFLHDHPLFRAFSGVCMALTGLFLALPLPPGTNFTPALGIAFLALGLLEDDGVMTLIGYLLFLLNLLLFVVLPLIGFRFLVKIL